MPPSTRRSLSNVLLLAALSLAAHAAVAAEPARDTRGAKLKPIEPVMTRAELRECMALQDRNKSESAELVSERTKLDADNAALKRAGDALKEQLATLDRTSADAVAKYNEQVTAREAAVESLVSRSNAFNARVEANQASRANYTSTCGNRRFDERDETAIRNGK